MSERERDPETNEDVKPEPQVRRPEGFIPISTIVRGRRFNVSLGEKIRRAQKRQRLGWR